MKNFKASLNNFSKIASLGIFGLVIFLVFQNLKTESIFPFTLVSTPIIALYISLPVVIFVFLFKPLSYTISESEIIINRLIFPFKIHRNEIVKCSSVTKDEMSKAFRTFGNGGLFGYTGYFRNTKFGTMRWLATQRKNYVLIEKTNRKKIVITPDEPENFISELG